MRIWSCKIGEVDEAKLPEGADAPMRAAVRATYVALTGEEPAFIFSGWGATLDESERIELGLPNALPIPGSTWVVAPGLPHEGEEIYVVEVIRDLVHAPQVRVKCAWDGGLETQLPLDERWGSGIIPA